MAGALLLVMADERKRAALAQAVGGTGMEVVEVADPAMAARQLPNHTLAAVVAELGPRRLAVGQLFKACRRKSPRPRAFVLVDPSGEPPDDAWEASPLARTLGPLDLAERVQRGLGRALPLAWRFKPVRQLARHDAWSAHWAVDPRNEEACVLVRVSATDADDPTTREAFLSGARTAAALALRGAARPAEVGGEVAGDLPFLTYRLPRGVTLSEIVRTQGTRALDLQAVLVLGLSLARTLDALHATGDKGLGVHGAVERRSVWLDVSGEPSLLYTGLSPLADEGRLVRGSRGKLARRRDELAPEQIRGVRPEPRSDLYRLGILLYVLAAGRSPFERKKPEDGVAAALNTRPLPPSKVNPDISPGLDALILALLAKERGERPGTALEVVERLEALLAAQPPPHVPWHRRLFRRKAGDDSPQGRMAQAVAKTLAKIEAPTDDEPAPAED